ncbi:hypothetical protein LCGC14_0303210 [marine sediment metagenome]|uniref:NodB homology domain-containing protein n=1 Tax=marine sediment metagenome TaxID=412755 RepID=A0A0F9TPQ9_9ZZZZ
MLHHLKKLTERPKWTAYEKLITEAIENGYHIMGVYDFWRHRNSFIGNDKMLVLRHDIDNSVNDAYHMFLLEKELGVKSTFYFRWKTVSPVLIAELQDEGFEVGFHHEPTTLSLPFLLAQCTYVETFSEYSYQESFIKANQQQLKNDVSQFQHIFGNINSIVAHGHRVTTDMGISNSDVVNPEILKELGVISANDLMKDNAYRFIAITDQDSVYGIWNKESNSHNPHNLVARGKNIVLLTHPSHWGKNFFKRLATVKYHKWFGVIT